MNFPMKRRLMVAVVLGSLLLIGATKTMPPQLPLRGHAAMFLLSQYKAVTGDGEGAAAALLAATGQRVACTAAISQSLSQVSRANVTCGVGGISKRT